MYAQPVGCAPMYDEVDSPAQCAPMYDEVESVSSGTATSTSTSVHHNSVEGVMPPNPLFHNVLDSPLTTEEQPPDNYFPQYVPLRTEDQQPPDKCWNDANIEVVKKWKKNLKHTLIGFSHLLESNSSNLQRVLLLSLIASACLSALQVLIVTLGAVQANSWIIFGFNLFSLLGNGFILIVSGLNQVYGWDGTISKLTRIVEQIDSLWLTLDTELNLPVFSPFQWKRFCDAGLWTI
jgi:hypothetical protein